MKFCKNLQQIIDIADPEWAPYWTNYKMLKKLIKELPPLVPSDDVIDSTIAIKNAAAHVQHVNNLRNNNNNNNSTHNGTNTSISSSKNNENNMNTNNTNTINNTNNNDRSDSPLSVSSSQSTISITSLITNPSATSSTFETNKHDTNKQPPLPNGASNRAVPEPVPIPIPIPAKINRISIGKSIGTSPGELAFFKLLRSELNKASRFFDRANQELSIREERVRDGIDILNHHGSTMVNDKWSSMAKVIYRLYKDLLLLELYAIMTYTSFSKILKKHDKNTGYQTRIKFMTNVVNKANFTHYPNLLAMIRRCEAKYEQVDTILVREGKSTSALDEDERLFISMIHRFYGQIMDKAQQEGVNILSEQRMGALGRRQSIMSGSSPSIPEQQQQQQQKQQQQPQHQNQYQPPELSLTSSLKSLVEENDAATKKSPASTICLSDDPDDGSNCNTVTGTETSADKCIGTNRSTNCTTGLKRPAEDSMKDDIAKNVVKKCKK